MYTTIHIPPGRRAHLKAAPSVISFYILSVLVCFGYCISPLAPGAREAPPATERGRRPQARRPQASGRRQGRSRAAPPATERGMRKTTFTKCMPTRIIYLNLLNKVNYVHNQLRLLRLLRQLSDR